MPRARINRSFLIRKIEGRIGGRDRQIRIVKAANRANIFPVAVEQMALYSARANRQREDFLPKILIIVLRKNFDQHIAIEEVNAHAGQAFAALAGNALRVKPRRIGANHFQLVVRCRLL